MSRPTIITMATEIIMLTEPFMQRAILAALFLAPLCGLLGVFVTARKLAFFSDTIAHAALAGIALGVWWGAADPTIPMVFTSMLVACGLLWLKENTELLTDTLMALLLSGSVALGILILSKQPGFRGELHRYLFGDILAISSSDVWVAAILLGVVGMWTFYKLSALSLVSVQEDLAHTSGLPVKRLNYIFILVLTLVVAMSIRLVGIILVTSLLVIPAAAARNLSTNLYQQIIWSVLLALLCGVGGTIGAYPLEAPCGPVIVMACVAAFLVSLAVSKLRAREIAA